MIKGVAFDLEGTVIDVEWAHHQGHIEAAREVHVSLDLDSALMRLPHFIGGPDEEVAKEIFSLSDGSKTVEQILERTRFHYARFIETAQHVGVREGFHKIFDYLRSNTLKFSIGSLTPRRQALFLLSKSGLGELFDANRIVLGDDVLAVKPAPDVYQETAKLMGINPPEQLVFEDSPNGVKAAKRAGSRVIAMPIIKQGKALMDLIQAGADRIFLDWREMNLEGVLANLNMETGQN